MGSDELISSSFVSLSLSASASGSVYSYLNGIHKDKITSTDIKNAFNLNDEQLKNFGNMKFQQFLMMKV